MEVPHMPTQAIPASKTQKRVKSETRFEGNMISSPLRLGTGRCTAKSIAVDRHLVESSSEE
jgi:hypothetical protein